MSNLGFRDSSVVIIETSRTAIRGGLGLHELLRTFSVVSIQQAHHSSLIVLTTVYIVGNPSSRGLAPTTCAF
jgi:hypothetical protein